MTDFLSNLYEMDNVILILTYILIGLIILFVIVLIFGKKDQKLEETKRLQKITEDSFKEDNAEPVKVEIKKEELPMIEEENVEVKEFTPAIEKTNEISPLLSENKEEIEIPEIKFNEVELENDLKELENIKNKFNEINISKVEDKKEEKNEPQVFSSVYVARQTNEESNNKEVTVTKEKTFLISDDEDDTMELPSLKIDEENSTLNDISGETYNL